MSESIMDDFKILKHIHTITVRWAGQIGKSKWAGLEGTGSGDSMGEACLAAIKAAKESRLPK